MALCGYWTSPLHTGLLTGESFLFSQTKIYARPPSLGLPEFSGGIAVAHDTANKCYWFIFVQRLWKQKDMSEINCWLKSIHGMKTEVSRHSQNSLIVLK